MSHSTKSQDASILAPCLFPSKRNKALRLSLFVFDILGERKTSLFKSLEPSNCDIDQMGVLESTKIQQNNLWNMNK